MRCMALSETKRRRLSHLLKIIQQNCICRNKTADNHDHSKQNAEYNLDVIKTADYIIDMGPEGGDGGGRVVAKGTPEEVGSSRM